MFLSRCWFFLVNSSVCDFGGVEFEEQLKDAVSALDFVLSPNES